MKQFGTRFHGTNEIKTSVANEEIVPKGVVFYKFTILIDQDCTVSINNSPPIFLRGGMAFSTEQNDAVISSFKILEDGKTYSWVGGE